MSRFIFLALAFVATSGSAFATVPIPISPAPHPINESSVAFHLEAPAGSTNINFNYPLIPHGFKITGQYTIQKGSNGIGAEPAGDHSNYLTVNPGQIAEIKSTSVGYNTVSFYWGSIDSYNTVDILRADGSSLETFHGYDLVSSALDNGNQSDETSNQRVTFTTADAKDDIYGLQFTSSSPAFEIDNVAFSRHCKPVAALPESGTWAMMLGGFGLMGASLRRSKKSDTRKVVLATA